MSKRMVFFIWTVLIWSVIGSNAFAEETEIEIKNAENVSWTVNWQGVLRSGTYSGGIADGYPQGMGTFTGDLEGESDDISSGLTYEGEWEEGKFHGTGVLTDYLENIVYEGEFLNGKLNGEIKESEITGDRNYVIRNYKEDVPVNVCISYNQEGECTDFDCYFRGISVNEICLNASEYKYWKLYSDPSCEYSEIKLDCRVDSICYGPEKDPSGKDVMFCRVKVSGEDGFKYLLKYDVSHGTVATNYMPFLNEGDRITVYGYFVGTERFDGESVKYPCIDAVCTDGLEDEIDIKNLPYLYDKFLNYSYLYKDTELTLEGTFKGIYSTSEKWIYFLLKSSEARVSVM